MDGKTKLRKISDEVFNLSIPVERLNLLLEDMEADYFCRENIDAKNEDDKLLVFVSYRDNRIRCDMANAEMIKIQELISKIEKILNEGKC